MNDGGPDDAFFFASEWRERHIRSMVLQHVLPFGVDAIVRIAVGGGSALVMAQALLPRHANAQ